MLGYCYAFETGKNKTWHALTTMSHGAAASSEYGTIVSLCIFGWWWWLYNCVIHTCVVHGVQSTSWIEKWEFQIHTFFRDENLITRLLIWCIYCSWHNHTDICFRFFLKSKMSMWIKSLAPRGSILSWEYSLIPINAGAVNTPLPVQFKLEP